MTEDYIKPFDMQYVLKQTAMHIKIALDRSTRLTYERLEDRPDKNEEIRRTLDVLQKWKNLNEDFEKNNLHLFDTNSDD